jgi:hypothetical protein
MCFEDKWFTITTDFCFHLLINPHMLIQRVEFRDIICIVKCILTRNYYFKGFVFWSHQAIIWWGMDISILLPQTTRIHRLYVYLCFQQFSPAESSPNMYFHKEYSIDFSIVKAYLSYWQFTFQLHIRSRMTSFQLYLYLW